MTALFVASGMALTCMALLMLFGAASWRAAIPVAAVLLAGVGGYAMQGRPDLPGSPTAARQAAYRGDTQFTKERGALLANMGDVGGWLNFADALQRAGMTEQAVEAMKVATAAFPRSPDLWVGLGNALAMHGDGFVSPAARLAFARAAQIAPDHPAPLYFLGLAYLQSGQADEALRSWEQLRARLPADAPWRPMIDERIRAVKNMQAAGTR